eukprot:COSAG02_NODE_2698_length_8208_cov_10.377482_4_plen_163_part_00
MSTDLVQNPMNLTEDPPDIEQQLKDGTLTAEQAVVKMEQRLRAERESLSAELAELRAALGGGAGGGVKSAVARLTEAPANFHQACVHFAVSDAPEDVAMMKGNKTAMLLLSSGLMVLFQTVACIAMLVGAFLPSCFSSDQCERGEPRSARPQSLPAWRLRCP